MFRWTFDAVHGIAVMLFTGTTNTDADFEAYLRVLARLDEMAAERESPIVILVADPGNPPPNALWRKRIAEATAQVRVKNALFVLVSESALVRGVVTSINWIRKPPYAAHVVATFEEAVALGCAHGWRRPAKAFHALLAEARESATTAR